MTTTVATRGNGKTVTTDKVSKVRTPRAKKVEDVVVPSVIDINAKDEEFFREVGEMGEEKTEDVPPVEDVPEVKIEDVPEGEKGEFTPLEQLSEEDKIRMKFEEKIRKEKERMEKEIEKAKKRAERGDKATGSINEEDKKKTIYGFTSEGELEIIAMAYGAYHTKTIIDAFSSIYQNIGCIGSKAEGKEATKARVLAKLGAKDKTEEGGETSSSSSETETAGEDTKPEPESETVESGEEVSEEKVCSDCGDIIMKVCEEGFRCPVCGKIEE